VSPFELVRRSFELNERGFFEDSCLA